MAVTDELLAQVDQSLFGFPDSVHLPAPAAREVLRLARAGRQALAAWDNATFEDMPGPCVLALEDDLVVVDRGWFDALRSALEGLRSPEEHAARVPGT